MPKEAVQLCLLTRVEPKWTLPCPGREQTELKTEPSEKCKIKMSIGLRVGGKLYLKKLTFSKEQSEVLGNNWYSNIYMADIPMK